MRTKAFLLAGAMALLGTTGGPAAHGKPGAGCVLAPAASTVTEAAAVAVEAELAATFGDPKATDLRQQLRRGLIGSIVDGAGFTVVVDPQRVDSGVLQRRLSTLGVPVAVRPGCFSTVDILTAGDVLAGRSWHPAASRTGHSYHLDPADSTYHVSFAPADRAVGEALQDALGALVKVAYDAEAGPAIQTGGDRFNDLQPYTGGAFILPFGSTTARQCTSGFAVTDGFGVLGSVTAGHCAGNGNIVNYTTGSGAFYGQTQGSVQNSTQDMARLHGFFTVSYEPVIYTDPGAPTTRRVVGKADPTLASLVCVSGSLTGAKCSVRITGLNTGTVFDPVNNVTTGGLMVGTRSDVNIVQPGDSGGPVYTPSGAGGATIRGMIVGRNGPRTVYIHPVSKVESGLGVTVAIG